MKTFVATRFERDGRYGENIEARDWDEARRIARAKGWQLDGELRFSFSLPSILSDLLQMILRGLGK
jgi:hypothetical protein